MVAPTIDTFIERESGFVPPPSPVPTAEVVVVSFAEPANQSSEAFETYLAPDSAVVCPATFPSVRLRQHAKRTHASHALNIQS